MCSPSAPSSPQWSTQATPGPSQKGNGPDGTYGEPVTSINPGKSFIGNTSNPNAVGTPNTTGGTSLVPNVPNPTPGQTVFFASASPSGAPGVVTLQDGTQVISSGSVAAKRSPYQNYTNPNLNTGGVRGNK